MIKIIFNLAQSPSYSPNEILKINSDYSFGEQFIGFGDLSKTNIFIGENNSGKSRFLRYLFNNDWYGLTEKNIQDFFNTIMNPTTVQKKYELSIYDFNTVYKIKKSKEHTYSYNSFFESLVRHSIPSNNIIKYYFPTLRGVKNYKEIINTKLNKFLQTTTFINNKDSVYHYLDLLKLDSNGFENYDIYNSIINQEYFNNKKGPKIKTGNMLYNEIKSMLLGDSNKRKLIDDFQIFIKNTFFPENQIFQLIPREDKQTLFMKIDNEEREIYNWGDGTQQLIIMFFYFFINKDISNIKFFIEEPETYLHPGILRKFIEVINSDIFKKHQFFITTHSNVILDVSADININMSIFKFKKNLINNPPFTIEQCNNGDLSLLNELGVRNSSLFLSNCSIWVEGITDRMYLKHFLNLYCKENNLKEFRENLDYTFIEYGGKNLIHFNFNEIDDLNKINAKYVNNKIFLIADNDCSKKGSTREKNKALLAKSLGENFYETKCREIENLLTLNILKSVLIHQNPSLEETINVIFNKHEDLSRKHLGKYIDNKLKETKIKKYSNTSGSIKDKLKFCQAAIENMKSFNELSNEAQELTVKIFNFIKINNK